MYSLYDYGDMLLDRRRTDAYTLAIRACVTPGSVVLEIGAGPGMMTLLACQAGAKKVYAVETDGIIQVARDLAAANGYADRVEVIQALSTDVTLPEPVDVILSDLHGVLPFFQSSLTSIFDARDRCLKPGGVLIPARETVWAGVIAAPALYQRLVGPWDQGFGFNCTAARQRAVNSWTGCDAKPASLVVEPTPWIVVDYRLAQQINVRSTVEWAVGAGGEAHGLCLWFECETAPGVIFSNAPGVDKSSVYKQAFFPWPYPQLLQAGDRVVADIRADRVGEDYLWSWNTEIHPGGGRTSQRATFRQSQFFSAPFSADSHKKSDARFVPAPNRMAAVDRMILDLLFADISLEVIARRVAEAFPDRFPVWQQALTRVGELSMRYST